jgi:hypothetical protein
MNRTRIITACYGSLIGIVTLLVLAPLAAADSLTLRAFPSWDDQINKPHRFKVLKQFNNAAVLDKETGLVWEQSPSTSTFDWVNALAHCYPLELGGRKGWRPPTVEELASLVDTSNSSPTLPTGHPFTLTSAQEDGFYWSATTDASVTSRAWVVSLGSGVVRSDFGAKTNTFHVWCVRGGQGIDGVQ